MTTSIPHQDYNTASVVICDHCANQIPNSKKPLVSFFMAIFVDPSSGRKCSAYTKGRDEQNIVLRKNTPNEPLMIVAKGSISCTVGNFDGHCLKFTPRSTPQNG